MCEKPSCEHLSIYLHACICVLADPGTCDYLRTFLSVQDTSKNIIYRRRLCLHWVMELSASVLMWEISPLYNIFVHNEVLYINLLSGIILGPSASFPYSLITTRK